MTEKERVCVTGAGGYQASWLVKLLLSKGYIVHGTVRDPSHEKNAHLKQLENASANLRLFKAELLDYDSIYASIEGCSGVFHVASPCPGGNSIPEAGPISNPEEDLIKPAVEGTLNILKACSAAKVKKVVIVSSIAAIIFNPNWPKEQAMDESCWSDKDFCLKTGDCWYTLSKTEAESKAWEYAKTTGMNIVTVCPSIIVGPMLQSSLNSSSWFLIMLMRDGLKRLENPFHSLVDVRDVAEALLLVYEKPEAEGRYICSSYSISLKDLVEKLKSMHPNYNYPEEVVPTDQEITSEKLVKLGWNYRELEESLGDSIKCYQEKGFLAEA